MNIAKRTIVIVLFLSVVSAGIEGCAIFGKKSPDEASTKPQETPAKSEGTAPTTDGLQPKTTPDPNTTRPSSGATAPAEQDVLRLVAPADGAADVDPKLPLEWQINPGENKVLIMNINIAEVGPDGVPSPFYCAVLTSGTDIAMIAKRKWTAFEDNVALNWMLTGDDYKQLKQLKPKTKYAIEFGVLLNNGKSYSVKRTFTTR